MSCNWNTGAERIKGYRRDEIVGQHFSRFYSEEDRRGRRAREGARETAAASGKYEAEGWRVRKDGSDVLGERGDQPPVEASRRRAR